MFRIRLFKQEPMRFTCGFLHLKTRVICFKRIFCIFFSKIFAILKNMFTFR